MEKDRKNKLICMCQFEGKEKRIEQLCNFHESFFFSGVIPFSPFFCNEENKIIFGKKIYKIK